MYKTQEDHFCLENCISLITVPIIYILHFILNPFTFLYPSWNHIFLYWTAPTLVCKWTSDIFCPVRCGSCLDLHKIVYFLLPQCHSLTIVVINIIQTCLAQARLYYDLQQSPSILYHDRWLWLQEKIIKGKLICNPCKGLLNILLLLLTSVTSYRTDSSFL